MTRQEQAIQGALRIFRRLRDDEPGAWNWLLRTSDAADVWDSLKAALLSSSSPAQEKDHSAELAAVGNDTGSSTTEAASGKDYDAALDVTLEHGALVVRIGVRTLAHACTYADWANPFDEKADDYIRTFAIVDALEFGKDIGRAMENEREDGSSPLTDFIDTMSQAALDDGSMGQHDEEVRIKHGETHPLETWALAVNQLSTGVSSTPAASPALKDSSTSVRQSPHSPETATVDASLSGAADDIAQYLKDGETVMECIARNRADTDAVLTLLAREKRRSKLLYNALQTVMRYAPGYDWNADDEKLTLVTGEAFQAYEQYFALSGAASTPALEQCEWKIDDDDECGDRWQASCGADWVFPEGGPAENKMKFCPECGKPLTLVGGKIAERSSADNT